MLQRYSKISIQQNYSSVFMATHVDMSLKNCIFAKDYYNLTTTTKNYIHKTS